MLIQELLVENNRQDLYHSTTLENAFKILDSGYIKAYSNDGEVAHTSVSLTRNPRLWFSNKHRDAVNLWHDSSTAHVTFVIDQNKLSHRVKMLPFNWDVLSDYDPNNLQIAPGGHSSEEEERAMGDIPLSCVKEVWIKQQDWDTRGLRGHLKRFQSQCRKLNIPVKVDQTPHDDSEVGWGADDYRRLKGSKFESKIKEYKVIDRGHNGYLIQVCSRHNTARLSGKQYVVQDLEAWANSKGVNLQDAIRALTTGETVKGSKNVYRVGRYRL
jgi:hypothetical protein